ncbi:MAG: hypothetical protein SGI77_25235 [Pirellulaceae bacterium]|nr:hypothetical protein [Pirellulaceae bacterium]
MGDCLLALLEDSVILAINWLADGQGVKIVALKKCRQSPQI